MNNIKTPQQLLKFKYKWMDKQGNFHNSPTPEMYTNYSLMTPEEVLINKAGICLDKSLFEKEWFNNHNYENKVMTIQIHRSDSSPGHAFLIYKENDKYCWFENAWESYQGIHVFNSYEELIKDVMNKFIYQNDIAHDETPYLIIKECPNYPYHISYEEIDKIDIKMKY